MVSMGKLFDRLKEIALEQGAEDAHGLNNRIAEMIGRSSGRVGQIKTSTDPNEKLGEDSLARLVRLGYSPDWVNHGKLPKRLKDMPPASKMTDEQTEWMNAFDWLLPEEKAAALERAKKNQQIAMTLGKAPPKTTPHKRTGTR